MAISVSGEALLPNSQMAESLPGKRGKDLAGISFMGVTITFMNVPPS